MPATPRPPLLRRLSPATWTALTWCLATAYSIVILIRLPGEVAGNPDRSGLDQISSSGIDLTAATIATLAGSALLRRRPLPALALMLTGSIFGAMAMNSTEIGFLQFLAVDVALYFIAASLARRTSIIAASMAIAVLAGFTVTRLLLRFPIGTSTLLAVAMMTVIAWLIGNSVRQTRDTAERLTAQRTAQAVTTERLRISRELHDMVAHSIGIIALQSGAASRVIETQPAAARDAIQAVETASRETLSGLRRMLGALRQTELGHSAADVPLEPAPGLADLDRLAAMTTAAGIHVDIRWHGPRRPLPADIDLSAFRIIQEAITNVVRHANTERCQVTVDHHDDQLSIEITDDGQADAGTAGTGYGIIGMRERVGLLHGDFHAEQRPEGGFRVTARLPVPAGTR
jgi:signal transduction histidine kinase